MIHDDISPSALIMQGLEIEEIQYEVLNLFFSSFIIFNGRQKLALDAAALGTHSTDLERAKILERSNSLQRRFDAWSQVQILYIPAVSLLRSRVDNQGGGTPTAPQNIPLYLPSSLISTVTCDRRLIDAEFRFRRAQADTILNELRANLLLRSRLYQSKNRYSRGQAQQTRSNTLIATVEQKVKNISTKYKRNREALLRLSSVLLEYSWMDILKLLDDSDVVGLTSMDDYSLGDGKKKLPWIWTSDGTGGDDTNKITQKGE
jgi:hypothetical protein